MEADPRSIDRVFLLSANYLIRQTWFLGFQDILRGLRAIKRRNIQMSSNPFAPTKFDLRLTKIQISLKYLASL